MIRNFLITTLRLLHRNKISSTLNILGLSLSIAVCMIIVMHVQYELSYDKHFPKHDRIYRVTWGISGDNARQWAQTAPLIAEEIQPFFPEVEKTLRIKPFGGLTLKYIPNKGQPRSFDENRGCFADSTVFDVFDLQFISGNKETALNDFNSLVITRSMAEKYFGPEDPYGKILKWEDQGVELTVSGVIEDIPKNSHWVVDFIVPYKKFREFVINSGLKDLYYAKDWAGLFNYVLLKENTSFQNLRKKFPAFTKFFKEYEGPEEEVIQQEIFRLQPIHKIHLYSHLEGEMGVNGNITYISIFIIFTIFILVVSSVNYVNIATSLALKRIKEIAIKKAVGAKKGLIQFQLISESFFVVVLGGLLSFLFMDLFLPFYNSISGNDFSFQTLFVPFHIFLFVGILLFLGILSGLYPALFITRFPTVALLRGINDPGSSSAKLRKSLMVFQFVVSVFMIFSTLGIYRQMIFFQHNEMGFDKEYLVSMNISGSSTLTGSAIENPYAFKGVLQKLPFVLSASFCSNLPGQQLSVEGLRLENQSPDGPSPSIRFMRVDKDYIRTLGLHVTEGPGFTSENPSESKFILNEKAREVLNLENPIHTKGSSLFGGNGEIVGVIDNYHFASLHYPIEPLILEYNLISPVTKNSMLNNLIVKLSPGNIKDQLAKLESIYKNMDPECIVSFTFIDDFLNSRYINESKMSNLFKGFTLFTVLITCLGLFSITLYTAQLKTKEVGVRKVFGANRVSLVWMLSLKFISYILISFIIALPLAYLALSHWLDNFAYHTNISLLQWVITILGTLLLAFITIVFHAIRLANRNPVYSLRYE